MSSTSLRRPVIGELVGAGRADQQLHMVDPGDALRIGHARPQLQGALGEVGGLTVGEHALCRRAASIVLRSAAGWSPAAA